MIGTYSSILVLLLHNAKRHLFAFGSPAPCIILFSIPKPTPKAKQDNALSMHSDTHSNELDDK